MRRVSRREFLAEARGCALTESLGVPGSRPGVRI